MIDQQFRQIVDGLAARTPAPGGGGAAVCTAAMGAALFLMVVRFSRGKKENQDREGDLAAAEFTLANCTQRLLPMVERDGASFQNVTAAYRLPKSDADEAGVRHRAIQQAMAGAMVVPEEALCQVRDAFGAIRDVVVCAARNIASDLGVGAALLLAAAESCELTVRTNASYLEDRTVADAALDRVAAIRAGVRKDHDFVREHVDRLLG